MDFDEVVKKRKKIREYQQDRQIPTDIINKLLINAHSSRSNFWNEEVIFNPNIEMK